jgi:hypothetical protein
MAVRPGDAPIYADLLGVTTEAATAILLRAGTPDVAWCATCWARVHGVGEVAHA